MKAKLLALPFLALSLSACNMGNNYSKWNEIGERQVLSVLAGETKTEFTVSNGYKDIYYRTGKNNGLFCIDVKCVVNDIYSYNAFFCGQTVSYSIFTIEPLS